MTNVIDGEAVAREIRRELGERVTALKSRGVTPGLVAILVGDDPASLSYVRGKERDSAEIGIDGRTLRLPATISEADLITEIDRLNHDPAVHALFVQLPVPNGLDGDAASRRVLPEKDADGQHPENLGLLLRGAGVLLPATPAGIQQLLIRTDNDPAGKHVVIAGRSNLVGKPLAALLMQKGRGANATVTICHTATPDLAAETRRADILIAAIGRPRAITADHVRPGAVVIDVGVNRIADATRARGHRLVGDVDYDTVAQIASAITPVPGGVGPMTRAMLLVNAVTAAERQSEGEGEG